MAGTPHRYLSIGWALLAIGVTAHIGLQVNAMGGLRYLGWPAGLEALLAFVSLLIAGGLWAGESSVHALVRWDSFLLLLVFWPVALLLMFLSPTFSIPFVAVLVLAHSSRGALEERDV